MERYFVTRDDVVIGSAATREAAMDMVRSYQELETHYLLKANFAIIRGQEELIPYENRRSAR